MKISIDYFDTLRTLSCFQKLQTRSPRCGAHPSNKGPLVRRMITVTADHQAHHWLEGPIAEQLNRPHVGHVQPGAVPSKGTDIVRTLCRFRGDHLKQCQPHGADFVPIMVGWHGRRPAGRGSRSSTSKAQSLRRRTTVRDA
jgi:hypothetical protein